MQDAVRSLLHVHVTYILLCTIFSKCLHRKGSRDIGLKLLTDFRFPDLGIGVTFEIFQDAGTIFCVNDGFNILTNISKSKLENF